MFTRWAQGEWARKFHAPYVHIVFGARQTGKSTLVGALLPPDAVRIDLASPAERVRYESDPDRLVRLCRALPEDQGPRWVFIDEIQCVPALFDAVQHLYDGDKRRWRFVLCGSSARKLRRSGANLLPGRSFFHRLYPLMLAEHPAPMPPIRYSVPKPIPIAPNTGDSRFPTADLLERLAYGELPGIVTAAEAHRADLLESYTLLHIEEEVRREALVKDLGAFVRFLRLAATESGQRVNYHRIAQDTGISVPTVKSHYQLLEDMFLGFRLPAFSGSPRKSVLSTDRFVLFDVGVRHAAAGLKPSANTVLANPGPVFEQWVGIELWKRTQYQRHSTVRYFRTRDGAEVDFVVEREGRLYPIEVKWTENPTAADSRHLEGFLREHPKTAPHGYVVCRCAEPMALSDRVMAIPWFCL